MEAFAGVIVKSKKVNKNIHPVINKFME